MALLATLSVAPRCTGRHGASDSRTRDLRPYLPSSAEGGVDVRGDSPPGAEEGTSEMKHIAGKTLKIAGSLVLVGACAVLIAGQDDIRRFRRMRSM
jgi:hypothetical protein